MPPTRIAKGTFAAAVSALVLLPTAGASASTPTPDTPSAPARHDVAPPQRGAADRAAPCSDTVQVGKTTHIRSGGEIIASLKHFYSRECNRDYGYIWVWKSFLDKHRHYKTCVGLYDPATRQTLGNHCRDNLRELYSYPVPHRSNLEPRGSVTVLKAMEHKSNPSEARR